MSRDSFQLDFREKNEINIFLCLLCKKNFIRKNMNDSHSFIETFSSPNSLLINIYKRNKKKEKGIWLLLE